MYELYFCCVLIDTRFFPRRRCVIQKDGEITGVIFKQPTGTSATAPSN